MAKKFETLHTEWLALVFATARLVDARDAGDVTAVAKLEIARTERDSLALELRRRDPRFDRWEC
jgi:hypothetical protein